MSLGSLPGMNLAMLMIRQLGRDKMRLLTVVNTKIVTFDSSKLFPCKSCSFLHVMTTQNLLLYLPRARQVLH
jgi:hypothetical protein